MEQEREQVVDQIVRQARACRAAQLVVEDRAGRETRVGMSPRGSKQLPLRRVLGSMDWTGIKFLDAAGDVLDVYQLEAPAVEEAEDQAPAPIVVPQSREAELMAVMTAAQAQVLDRFAALVKPIVEGYQALSAVVQARLDHAEAQAAAELEARAQLIEESKAAAAESSEAGMEQMVAQLVGHALQAKGLMPPAQKPPGNGG